MEGILDVNESAMFDNSISSIETHTYVPYVNSFRNSDEVRIVIQQADLLIHTADSFLYIEGTYLKEDGKPSTKSKLVNNAMAFLFDEARYELNSFEIDRTKNLGITSTMKGYASFNRDDSSTLQHTGWCENDSQIITNGHFNYCVPLKSLMGVAEDFNKIFINAKHELILIRSRNDTNAMEIVDAEKMILTITKMAWKVQHLRLSDSQRLEVLKTIDNNTSLQIYFRSWDMMEFPTLPNTDKTLWNIKTSSNLQKPRYVIVGFQTARKNKDEENSALFDHCDIRNIKLHLNSEIYPYDQMNLNFTLDQYSIAYNLFTKFQQSFYQKSNQPMMSYTDFKTRSPLYILDCSRQNESIKTSLVDIKLEIEATKNFPVNTSCYALIIHDTLIEYNPLSGIVKKM